MSYIRLEDQDITISSESIAAPLWSGNENRLTEIFRSSAQIASNTGEFYHEIYNKNPSEPEAEVQFSIAFGDKEGRGARPFNEEVVKNTPSSVIYGQYRNLVFGDESREFKFGGVPSKSIFVINIDRARYKEKLLPGAFNLRLDADSEIIQLTDNSGSIDTVSFVDAGRVFDIVEGENGIQSKTNEVVYGKFLPDVGVIILSGESLKEIGNFSIITQPEGGNLDNFFDLIRRGELFEGQSEETVTSNFVYIRPRNAELNYTTNPSNLNDQGELIHDVMVNSPRAYITTIGLYNDNNDLIAVAKLSRPLPKDFTKEALIRVKLDY